MFRFNPCKKLKKNQISAWIKFLHKENFKNPRCFEKRKNYRFCCLLFFHMKKVKNKLLFNIPESKARKIVSLIPSDMFNQNPESNRNSTLMFIKSKNKCKRTNIQRIPFGHRFSCCYKILLLFSLIFIKLY